MKINSSCFIITWVVIISLGLTVSAHGQRKVEFRITAADESGAEVTMVAGVDDRATDSLDMKLGEQFLPGHPPAPSSIHAALLVENQLSYKNYRRIPDTNRFSLDYTINVNDYTQRNAPFFFKWEYPFPKHIDSAKIMDRLDGKIYSFPLDSTKKSILITNEGLAYYNLVIWYNLPPSGVSENDTPIINEKSKIVLDKDLLTINSHAMCKVNIYNTLANKLIEAEIENGTTQINTSTLTNGVYFVVLSYLDGTITTKKILISR